MPDQTPPESWKSPSWLRIAIACAIAVASDTFSFFTSALLPTAPLVIGVDVATAVLIWWALGRPVLMFMVFLAEAIPGVGMVPLWTIVVAVLAFTGRLPAAMARKTLPPNHQAP